MATTDEADIELSFDASRGAISVRNDPESPEIKHCTAPTEDTELLQSPNYESEEDVHHHHYTNHARSDSLHDLDIHFPIANIQGQPAHYPESPEEGKQEQDTEAKNKKCSLFFTTIDILKYTLSLLLLVFSVVMVMAAIFQKQTTTNIPPAAACVVFWFLLVWLATMEGGQGALVGLQPIDKSLYAESHARAFKCTTLAHKGDNMERFIVGRQFLVVLVLFITNIMASAVDGATVLGMPSIVNEVFLSSGLALILTTIMIGQLTAQINSASCMLDFINNYFVLFTIYVSLLIEMSGLLHCVYLVQIFFARVTRTPMESNEPPPTILQQVFFWFRVFMSVVILGFCFAVTLAALFQGKTLMWHGVPAAASVVIFFVLMAFVGMLEGMQIALFAVVNLSEEELKKHPIAHQVCQLTFQGHNLQAFLIGRQICVTLCTFVVARITSLSGTGENIFGVSDGWQQFFNTGLLGAVITTIVASLMWRVIASSFPVAFLSNPIIYLIVQLCLVLERTGICSAAYLLAFVQKKVMAFQPDDVYIAGTAEERTERGDLELGEEEQQGIALTEN